jgi:hypothetical protein
MSRASNRFAMGRHSPVCLPLIFCLLAGAVQGAEPATVQAGWLELAQREANRACEVFAAVPAADPVAREARLGEAVSLLSAQPGTPAKIAMAERILAGLRAALPNDESGLAAAYYLARIHQLHDDPPDRLAAVAGYRELISSHAGSFYAQLAAPKLALLLLFDDVPRDEWDRREAEVTALIGHLDTPESRRDTQLILASALIKLRRDHARAYPLMVACLDAGLVVRAPHLNGLLLQAAESAAALGRPREAADFYARFLAEFPHDSKADEVGRRLAALKREARP